MQKFFVRAGVAVCILGMAAPGMANARHRHYHHGRYASSSHLASCKNAERRRGNTGAAIGGVGGALAGHALGHGSLGGTLIGAGVGAVAGHEIAKRPKGDC